VLTSNLRKAILGCFAPPANLEVAATSPFRKKGAYQHPDSRGQKVTFSELLSPPSPAALTAMELEQDGSLDFEP